MKEFWLHPNSWSTLSEPTIVRAETIEEALASLGDLAGDIVGWGEREKVQLINLTPHPVTFVTEDGETILELPGCPNPPRASETREDQGEVNGIPVNKVAIGQVQDLPEARPNTGYIVSRIVAEAARRSDLYIPDQTVRDEQGRIIGCRALAQV